jgi:hypothetical protein
MQAKQLPSEYKNVNNGATAYKNPRIAGDGRDFQEHIKSKHAETTGGIKASGSRTEGVPWCRAAPARPAPRRTRPAPRARGGWRCATAAARRRAPRRRRPAGARRPAAPRLPAPSWWCLPFYLLASSKTGAVERAAPRGLPAAGLFISGHAGVAAPWRARRDQTRS